MPLIESPADAGSSPAAAAPSVPASLPELAVPPRRRRYLWLWLTCSVCGLAAASYSLYPPGHSLLRSTAAASDEFRPLGLSARAETGKLLLTWNARPEAVKSARRAVLSITDGDRKEDVDLTLPVFRGGALVYRPVTEDVTLELTVSWDGAADSVESVRAAVSEGRTVPPVQGEVGGQPPITVDDVAAAPAAARNPRLFAPPTLTQHSASYIEVSQPPAIEVEVRPALYTIELAPDRPTAPAPPLAVPAPPVRRDPLPAAPNPAPAMGHAPIGPLRVASLTVLRRTVIPYPVHARKAHLGGTVTVEVVVGADGRVRQASAISGPEELRLAAQGVRNWLFEPPAVDGKRVEAITRVNLTFNPFKL
jgi:TonB family protein